MSASSIWRTADGTRHFLIPDDRTPTSGDFAIVSLDGKTMTVALDWLAPFEITEEQARRIAKDQLGSALTEIRAAIDGTLAGWRQQLDDFNRRPVASDTPVTPNAAPALLDLLKELPRAIGESLSGDDVRVKGARDRLASVQARLKEAGIDVEDRLTAFPDRLAELRRAGAPDRDPDTD